MAHVILGTQEFCAVSSRESTDSSRAITLGAVDDHDVGGPPFARKCRDGTRKACEKAPNHLLATVRRDDEGDRHPSPVVASSSVLGLGATTFRLRMIRPTLVHGFCTEALRGRDLP